MNVSAFMINRYDYVRSIDCLPGVVDESGILREPLMIWGALRKVALAQHYPSRLEFAERRSLISRKRGSRRLYYESKSKVEFLCHY